MVHDSKIVGRIKSQSTLFSHKISVGFKKPLRNSMVEMIYGIQAGQGYNKAKGHYKLP